MNPDFLDLLRAFGDADVRFLIVGAYALAHHGRPRATGDLERGTFGGVSVDYLDRDSFIRNKRATGRARDLGDIEGL